MSSRGSHGGTGVAGVILRLLLLLAMTLFALSYAYSYARVGEYGSTAWVYGMWIVMFVAGGMWLFRRN